VGCGIDKWVGCKTFYLGTYHTACPAYAGMQSPRIGTGSAAAGGWRPVIQSPFGDSEWAAVNCRVDTYQTRDSLLPHDAIVRIPENRDKQCGGGGKTFRIWVGFYY
jgi:hypothetical protein